MQKAVGTNYIKGDILLLHGVTCQNFCRSFYVYNPPLMIPLGI